jgi:hypothetical protein
MDMDKVVGTAMLVIVSVLSHPLNEIVIVFTLVEPDPLSAVAVTVTATLVPFKESFQVIVSVLDPLS